MNIHAVANNAEVITGEKLLSTAADGDDDDDDDTGDTVRRVHWQWRHLTTGQMRRLDGFEGLRLVSAGERRNKRRQLEAQQ